MLISCLLQQTHGHGMMLDPPGRSSRWRYDDSAPKNYDDNALYCGGFWKQTQNGNKCGLCGDDYSDALPRANELGGKYGQGVIVKSYYSSTLTALNVRITANHLGYFSMDLCNLDEFNGESDDCFAKYQLEFIDGNKRLYIGSTTGNIEAIVQFPKGVSCKHCVLRWTYTAGNNWGICENGNGALGCGAQETFRSCADISIVHSLRGMLEPAKQMAVELPVEVPEKV
ncbi:CG4367, partial [Drosophila busckii]